MKRFLKRMLSRYREWRCRRAYKRVCKLHPGWKALIDLVGADPDSKKARGEFE